MTKTLALLLTCAASLTACASNSPSVPCKQEVRPQPTLIATEAPGYFQTEWMQLLQSFKRRLADLSNEPMR